MGGRVGDEICIIVCAFSWLLYELHPFDSAVEPQVGPTAGDDRKEKSR